MRTDLWALAAACVLTGCATAPITETDALRIGQRLIERRERFPQGATYKVFLETDGYRVEAAEIIGYSPSGMPYHRADFDGDRYILLDRSGRLVRYVDMNALMKSSPAKPTSESIVPRKATTNAQACTTPAATNNNEALRLKGSPPIESP